MDKDENKKNVGRMVVEEIEEEKEKKPIGITLAPENIQTKENLPPKPAQTEKIEKKEEVKEEKPEKIKKTSSLNILWILIPGMLILGLLIGGIFAYIFGLKRISNPQSTPTPAGASVIPIASASPTAEASPSANLKKYKITILNGSGIAGEAGRVQSILETAGFNVASTGNADNYNFTKSLISVSGSVSADYVKALVAALSKKYQLGDPSTVPTQTDDVIVTVGSLKAE